MEVFSTNSDFLIISGEHALHCCRKTGKLTAKNPKFLHELHDPRCLGIVYGVVGRLSLNNDKENYILFIKQCKNVGAHPLNRKFVYKIQQVVAFPLFLDSSTNVDTNLTLDVCKKHSGGGINNELKKRTNIELNFLQKHQKKVFKATSDSLKFVSDQVVSRHNDKDSSKHARGHIKILDEILKLFNENCSFYFSDADLTNSIQRNVDGAPYDERYFWNRSMLSDLVSINDVNDELTKFWIKPIIQGFVEMTTSEIDLSTSSDDASTIPSVISYDLTVISRRSIHRAGTRYIKRGIDDAGNCANYVETEQILNVCGHLLSFVQLRASIPLYWSQPGYKYKPPPRMERTKSENTASFRRHFKDLHDVYGDLIVVNLVDQTGKEKILSDVYIEQVLDYDADFLTYVAFDFHEYCRGLKFENVTILVETLVDSLQAMKFCWIDKRHEFICRQTSTFRINCVDCLDRTNVVQSALAKFVLEYQLRKLGLLSPEEQVSKKCQSAFQTMWANNGDAVSRQYAGTAALKGDFTRTGQRNFAGMMRDGYNSANRYYLCHMKDAQRQAAIDVLLGLSISVSDIENVVRNSIENEESWLTEKDEHLRLLVLDCEKLVLPQDEVLLAGWALINADVVTGDETEDDMDTVVMLTRDAYYVADYDEQLDKFVDFQRISLKNIESIEVGQMTVSSLFGVARSKSVCVRVNYSMSTGDRGYFHVWRAGGTRLFNNLAIAIKSSEDADEYMRAIGEQFNVALEVSGINVPLKHLLKLDRKKSKLPPNKVIDQKNFGFISNLLSPLTSVSVKSVGNLLKSPSSTSGKMVQNNHLSSVVVNESMTTSAKTTPTVVKTFINDDIIDSKMNSFDAIYADCGVLFSSVCVTDKSNDVNFVGRRFSDASSVDMPLKQNSNIFQSPSSIGFPSPSPLTSRKPSTDMAPRLNVPDTQVSLQRGVSDSDINIEVSPPRDESTTCNNDLKLPDMLSMKTSHSESSLKKYETSKVEKSSSSVVLEKLIEGRKFFQHFQQGAQKTWASVGAKKLGPSHNVNHWSDIEDRVKSSRTKFILL